MLTASHDAKVSLAQRVLRTKGKNFPKDTSLITQSKMAAGGHIGFQKISLIRSLFDIEVSVIHQFISIHGCPIYI